MWFEQRLGSCWQRREALGLAFQMQVEVGRVSEVTTFLASLGVKFFDQLDGLLCCCSDRLALISPTLVQDLEHLLFVIQNLVGQMRANTINSIDGHSLGGRIFGFDNLVLENRQELVVKWPKVLLDVEDQRYHTLEQLLMGLEQFGLEDNNELVCDVFDVVEQDVVGAVYNDFGQTRNGTTLDHLVVALFQDGQGHGQELV